MDMDKALKQKGYKQLNDPYNGAIWYQCPKGHKINCFCNGDDYDCPVCEGHKPTIAGILSDLNEQRGNEV